MAELRTKGGAPVPEELANAIENDPRHKALWDVARPSCQTRYSALIDGARKPETRFRRVNSVRTMMAKTYGPKLGKTL
jgi:uncharacterized protein YdeI (YjbR/CyaY-like superfamily)